MILIIKRDILIQQLQSEWMQSALRFRSYMHLHGHRVIVVPIWTSL